MSTRASLVWIMIGALLAGYVGLHWGLARTLDVSIQRKWTGETAGRQFRTGTAHFVETDRGTFGFFGTPFTANSDEMYAQLAEGGRARVSVIDWLHGPLLSALADEPTRPQIVAVER